MILTLETDVSVPRLLAGIVGIILKYNLYSGYDFARHSCNIRIRPMLPVTSFSNEIKFYHTTDNFRDRRRYISNRYNYMKICSFQLLIYLLGLNAACVDKDLRCSGWAKSGECNSNPGYMLTNCRKSCDKCEGEYPLF